MGKAVLRKVLEAHREAREEATGTVGTDILTSQENLLESGLRPAGLPRPEYLAGALAARPAVRVPERLVAGELLAAS